MTTESLRTHLKLDELPLATTPEGKKFAIKALHPADHEIKATRVPGGIDNTVALQIDQVVDFPLTSNSTRVILAPLLDTPLMVEEWSADASNYVGSLCFQPPAFGGAGFTDFDHATGLVEAIRTDFESVVITSESMTLEFVAPALKNQGSIVAAQFPYKAQKVSIGTSSYVNVRSSTDSETFTMPFCAFDDYPEKGVLLSGTRAYTGQAVEGVYMPLRLTDFAHKYLNSHLCCGFGQPGAAGQGGSHIPRTSFNGVGYIKDRVGMNIKYDRFRPLGDTWGMVYVDNYATGEVSVRIRFRMTIEGRVYPGSNMAPLAEPPPPPDNHALTMYREIAGRLVNAYPARFNDWNQLKGTILNLANKLLGHVDPALELLNALPYGGAIKTIARPLLQGAQSFVQAKLKESQTPAKSKRKSQARSKPAPVAKTGGVVTPSYVPAGSKLIAKRKDGSEVWKFPDGRKAVLN